MNRAERRKAGKTEKPKVYTLTQDQIDGMERKAVEKAFKMFMSIPVMVLHDKFGFGNIRLDRFMHYALMWVQSVQDGDTSLTEIMKIAEDESGVKVTEC